jgi:hypothetical protein
MPILNYHFFCYFILNTFFYKKYELDNSEIGVPKIIEVKQAEKLTILSSPTPEKI